MVSRKKYCSEDQEFQHFLLYHFAPALNIAQSLSTETLGRS